MSFTLDPDEINAQAIKVFDVYKENLHVPPTHYDGKTPYEIVSSQFKLPFELYPFQQSTVNSLAGLQNAGYYLDVGAGKTATSIASSLFKFHQGEIETLVVIMPPILLLGWYNTLQEYPEFKDQVLIYRGTPAVRKKLDLNAYKVVLVGLQIFKQDFERFESTYTNKKTGVILDEATSIKNTSSQNHKLFARFSINKHVMLLTGTPLSTPADGYAYIKFTAPGMYKSKGMFLGFHQGHIDFFGKTLTWRNLELLNDNLKVNSARILKQDVLKELPEVVYNYIPYELDKKHAQLYTKMVNEQILLLEDGGKIDATTASGLHHKLGQIICNFDFFSGNEGARSTCYDVLDAILEEIGDEKLVVFSNYRMTNESLARYLAKYNAVTVYGGNSGKEKDENIQRFIEDPTCQVLIGQPTSMGYGVDGLQKVCSNGLFLEIPTFTTFHQAVARLHRTGQKQPVNIRIAVAQGTVQVTQQRNLLQTDVLLSKVIRNADELRKQLLGEET